MLIFRRVFITFLMLAGVWGGLTSCTGTLHKKWADREVFGILRRKAAKVPNSGTDLLSITPPGPLDLGKLPKNNKSVDFLGKSAHLEKGARTLKMGDALQYAVTRNRSYLTEKEVLYATALDLTSARWVHGPLLIGTGSGTHSTQRVEQEVNTFVKESTLTNTGAFSLSTLARTGARLAVDLTTDFSRMLTGNLRDVSNSRLAVSLSQPLLRGAGVMAASEPLTQAERSTLYAIRNFTQFRKSFTVDTATAFYETLRSRDAARNAHTAYASFETVVAREKALGLENKRTPSQVGLMEQAVLTYHRRWINAVRTYEESLDSLKIQLGLPITEKFVLDQDELYNLKLMDPPGTLDEALETAMSTRLELWNRRDELEDAERRVRIAKQNLLPGLSITGFGNVVGDKDADGSNLDGHRRDYGARLDLDLNLDQLPRRNDLRASQIAEQAARRGLELAEENVRQEIRQAWRNLDVARRLYELAEVTVDLCVRRLEQEEAFTVENRGDARNLIDAQQDLIDARDQRMAALVSHTSARLQLWRDMGVLTIQKDGRWVDVLKNEPPRGNPAARQP
jgi:outer membrane protein TolC